MKDESATDNGSGRIQDFTDLRVWQAAMTLAEEVYRLSDSFPARETYGLTAQIRRAVVSVPSNIAEGFARGHLKEYVQHLAMARGSLAEVRTQLDLAVRFRYVDKDHAQTVQGLAMGIGRQLTALRNSLSRRIDNHPSPITHNPEEN
jgi:four helix bundle protein